MKEGIYPISFSTSFTKKPNALLKSISGISGKGTERITSSPSLFEDRYTATRNFVPRNQRKILNPEPMSLQEDESVDNARWDHLSKSLIDLCDSIPVREACDEMVKRTLALVNEGQAKHGGDSKVLMLFMNMKNTYFRFLFESVKRGISRISARIKGREAPPHLHRLQEEVLPQTHSPFFIP